MEWPGGGVVLSLKIKTQGKEKNMAKNISKVIMASIVLLMVAVMSIPATSAVPQGHSESRLYEGAGGTDYPSP
jgi:hypothetical protein